jgi:hypothetical protein
VEVGEFMTDSQMTFNPNDVQPKYNQPNDNQQKPCVEKVWLVPEANGSGIPVRIRTINRKNPSIARV